MFLLRQLAEFRRPVQPPAKPAFGGLRCEQDASKNGKEGNEGGRWDILGSVGIRPADHQFDRAKPRDFSSGHPDDPIVANRAHDAGGAVNARRTVGCARPLVNRTLVVVSQG